VAVCSFKVGWQSATKPNEEEEEHEEAERKTLMVHQKHEL